MSLGQKKSQSRNRRVSNVRQRRQQHLLDVKVRSRRATQHCIRRAMGVLSRVILLAALLGAVYAGAREAARRLFFENPDYQLRTIELQTDGTLQREQVLKEADLREGENIFKVNLARVTIGYSSFLRPTKSRWCENSRARSIFAWWNESRSPGSRAKRKFQIHLRRMLLFWWTRGVF